MFDLKFVGSLYTIEKCEHALISAKLETSLTCIDFLKLTELYKLKQHKKRKEVKVETRLINLQGIYHTIYFASI